MWLYAKVQKWCAPRVVLTHKNIKGKVEGPQEPKNVKTTKYGLLKGVQTKKIKRDWESRTLNYFVFFVFNFSISD